MNKQDIVDIYNSSLPLKLIIQNIPYIGSSLDTIINHKGGDWRNKRFEALIHNLDEKIKTIQMDNTSIISQIQQKVDSEDFYYLFIQAVQKASMTHKMEKIEIFANLIKNFLIKDLSNEEYLIEIFLDITDNLSEYEISKLSELQSEPLEIYYTPRKKVFDLERMKKDISEQKLNTDFHQIPREYEYDDFYLYSYKRLEKYDLVHISTTEEYGGQTSAGWERQGQSQTVNFHYSKKDEISLSDFGKKYIEWVIN